MYRVLIVDDDPVVCRGLARLIDWNACGFSVEGFAGSGREALQKLRQAPFDLILTDIRMPEMNGIDLILELNRLGYPGCTIVLSAFAEFEYACAALRYGARDYLLKPIGESELTQSLAKAAKLLRERAPTRPAVPAPAPPRGLPPQSRETLERLREAVAAGRTDGLAELLEQALRGGPDREENARRVYEMLAGLAAGLDRAEGAAPPAGPPPALQKLLCLACRHLSESYAGQSASRPEDIVRRMEQYVRDYLAEDISLVNLSKVLFLSPGYLGRIFKAGRGVGFSDYLNACRLDRAAELLRGDGLMVYEVCERVGYGDLNYFYRRFRGRFGCTPTEYRARAK